MKESMTLLQRRDRQGIDYSTFNEGIDDITSTKGSTRDRIFYFNEGIDDITSTKGSTRDRLFYFNEETDDFTSMKGLIIFL
jgi:hypothetical protein